MIQSDTRQTVSVSLQKWCRPYDPQVSRKEMLQNLTEWREFRWSLFSVKKTMLLVWIREAFGVNRRCWSQGPKISARRRQNDDFAMRRDDVCINRLLLVRKRAPLEELAPFGGATLWLWWWSAWMIKTRIFTCSTWQLRRSWMQRP